jgi:hypothetical protein
MEQSVTLQRALEALRTMCSPLQERTSKAYQDSPSSDVAIPTHDLEEWREPFVHWLDSTCQRHPRLFGNASKLHLAYCEWEIANSGVPCTRETFLCLLEELGFLMGNIDGVLLVSGLTFRDDAEAILAAELREDGRQ